MKLLLLQKKLKINNNMQCNNPIYEEIIHLDKLCVIYIREYSMAAFLLSSDSHPQSFISVQLAMWKEVNEIFVLFTEIVTVATTTAAAAAA